ncbi:MAG: hypothetical protein RIR17_2178 [Planctomycetota bacterium]
MVALVVPAEAHLVVSQIVVITKKPGVVIHSGLCFFIGLFLGRVKIRKVKLGRTTAISR